MTTARESGETREKRETRGSLLRSRGHQKMAATEAGGRYVTAGATYGGRGDTRERKAAAAKGISGRGTGMNPMD